MSKECSKSNCPVDTLTGSYVSVTQGIPTATLTIRPAPGRSASGSSQWTGTDGKRHFGELQGQVKRMGDGQSPARSVWYGSCRVDGNQESYPFVMVASEDGTRLEGAYLGGTTFEFEEAV